MEGVFIQKIFQIAERIIRRDIDAEAVGQELQNHLAKARKLRMPLYEVEVLNTLGLLSTDPVEKIRLWQEALEKAIPLNNVDVHMKLLGNLTDILIRVERTQEAFPYMQQSLELIQQHQIRTIATLYAYGLASVYYMHLGQYDQAKEISALFWEVAPDATLENYSRYEYAQILTTMWVNRVELDIIARDEAAYQSNIKTLASFVEQINRIDHDEMLKAAQIYHAVIMAHDEETALRLEQEILQLVGGRMSPDSLLLMARFFHHNQQPAWARKYAQQLIEHPDTDAVTPAMIVRARAILAS